MTERGTGEPSISGAMVLSNIREFEHEVGAETVRAALSKLPPAVRDEYEAIVSAAWVPMQTVDAVFAAIAAEADRDLRELFPRVVERGVERTLSTVWRALLRFTSDKALMSRTPSIFRKTYSKGELHATFPQPRVAEVELSEWPNTPEYRLLAIAAGIRAVLRLAGRKGAVVDFERTPGGARFSARW